MREAVRCRAPGRADRAHLEQVVPGQCALAGLGLRDREPVLADEPVEDLACIAVHDAAANDHERAAAGDDRVSGPLDCGRVGTRTGHMVDVRLEERAGDVEGLRLHVLGEGQGDRTGLGR